MEKQLQEKIINSFPEFFKLMDKKDKPYYPIKFGIECNNGWYNLVYNYCKYLSNHLEIHNKINKNNLLQINIVQIKQKFGFLNIYLDYYPEGIRNVNSFVEQLSYETCEFCGTMENVGHTSEWIFTICVKCLNEKKINEDFLKKWKKI